MKYNLQVTLLSVNYSSNRKQSVVVTDQAADKPAALKLVLKVGAPHTPSDATSADSQSESVDYDPEKRTKTLKKKHQSEKVDHQEKKVL